MASKAGRSLRAGALSGDMSTVIVAAFTLALLVGFAASPDRVAAATVRATLQGHAGVLAQVAKGASLAEVTASVESDRPLLGVDATDSESDSDEELEGLTAEEKKELRAIRSHAGAQPTFEPPYVDQVISGKKSPAEEVKRLMNDMSTIEIKAEVLAGLRKDSEQDFTVAMDDREKMARDARQLEEIHKEMDSVRFAQTATKSESTSTKAQTENAATASATQTPAASQSGSSASFPAAQVAAMFARRAQDLQYQTNYFAQGSRIRERALFQSKRSIAQKYEDCMACRMIWRQVEMDVANARYVEDVESSFEHNCLDAQKSMIFYRACQDMENDLYAMVDDYMSGEYTVDKMCLRANMCVVGAKLGWRPGHRVFT